MMELGIRGFQVEIQSDVFVRYKQFQKTVTLKVDLLVNRCLLVKVKAVEAVLLIHLIINFNSPKLTDGISRLILPGANPD